jgi:hypothetical protein
MPGNDGAGTALRGWGGRIRSAPGDRQGVIGDLWNAAMPLNGFVEAIAKQVPAKR